MPECEICGEEADKLIKCKSCGAKFCEDCGSTIEKLCEFCAEDEDIEVTDDEEGGLVDLDAVEPDRGFDDDEV